MSDEELLEYESRHSFLFFWNEANTDPQSPAYGLIRDRAPGDPQMSSVASVGFGLTALVIGAERGWVDKTQAEQRVLGTLNTLLNHAEQLNGFFYHFLDMSTAKRYGTSELSIIDTGIAISGALAAGEYFGGEVKALADRLYRNVDWSWYTDKNPGSNYNQFYMGYSPEKGFSGHWDFYAEQFMLYFLGAASPTHPIDPEMFYDFIRKTASYGNYPTFIHSWFGSLFTHQFSFAWFDLRNKMDREGVDWWNNSVIATKSSRQYSIDNAAKYKTYGPDAWGFTASDGPKGYEGRYGSAPSGFSNEQHIIDGTVTPAGSLGSIVFTPEEVLSTLRHYYTYPNLIGDYGLKDAYNLDVSPEWYGPDVIGIDKGITLLMLENYRSGLVWNLMNQNKYVQSGMKKVGLTEIGSTVIDDFDGNTIGSGWTDGGDEVYRASLTREQTHTGTGALKVEYTKQPGKESAFLELKFSDVQNLSSTDALHAHIYALSATTLLVKLDGESGTIEKQVSVQPGGWSLLDWTFTAEEKAKLGSVNRLMITAAPGKSSGEGTFYLDDLAVKGKAPSASNLWIHGKPIVGETLTANYSYFSPSGAAEGASQIRWLKAADANGSFTPIPGATQRTYTVQKQDAGSCIKFEVTPVTAVDPLTNAALQGNPKQSSPSGRIEVAEPEARSVTITTMPKEVFTSIDDFDGQSIEPNWSDAGDNVFTLSLDNKITPDGGNAMRIDYNKGDKTWPFVEGVADPTQPVFVGDSVTMQVYGKYDFIFKLEEVSGQHEKAFKGDTQGTWQTLSWDISALKHELNDVKRIVFLVEPGAVHVSGTFYLDNLRVNRIVQTDLTTEGSPLIGTAVYGDYEYFNAKGYSEAGTTYRWLRAKTKDGSYEPIKGAAARTYTPTERDKGDYLKFEVRPGADGQPPRGEAVRSAASDSVLKDKKKP
ncbi:hypothetical protein CBW46_000565 [Paenibacillus xerothermodurans]|uniref:Uncharacterized protein n=2 Tax=Paenibacillus xerothermodurans TaxID=1977292 RepID=A0A2W1P716_PAEXE|nr:hypothetical protein CBW46_000565 [Paenibacillus xerothermodurans]